MLVILIVAFIVSTIVAILAFESEFVDYEKGEKKMSNWEVNAHVVEEDYGMFVDWEIRFYTCPCCGEPVYDCDWDEDTLNEFICPICEDIDL